MSQRALSVSRMTGNRSTFPDWYQAIVREAYMAEPSPVRGSMIIKPWGYGTWEQMQKLAIHVTPTRPVGFKTGPGFAPVKVTVGEEDESEDEG